MTKCIRCGATTIRSVALDDGHLCYRCFDELGFDRNDRKYYTTTRYDEIKDGYNVYVTNLIDRYAALDTDPKDMARKLGFSVAHYGEERTINATDEETQIFEVLQSMVSDPERLRLVRRSDNYVTAAIGDWDFARFKFTKRAKWIMFPYAEHKAPKHYIDVPEDVRNFADLAANSLAVIEKDSN